ncbi:MAG: c-type cytochrome biogenesis protein CcmI [Magnetospirillum sp. WYHS-4]
MINLWIFMACASAVALIGVLMPVFRRQAEVQPDRAEYDLAVYRDQLLEIDGDLERGLMAPAQADAARTEIQRRMLAVAPAQAVVPAAPGSGRDMLLAIGLAIAVPVAAIALYTKLGSPGLPDLPLSARNLGQERVADRQADMEKLVAQLAERLKKNPDDLKGWMVLARSLDGMERFGESVEAYARAVELSNRQPEIVGDYAEALVQAGGGDAIPDQALVLFEEVRAKDPQDPRPYFYKGASLGRKGDLKGAVQEWTDLVAVSPPDAPWLAQVRQSLAAATEKLGLGPDAVKPRIQGEAPAPSAAAPAEMSAEEQQAFIRQMVERLESRLKENPGDKDGWERLGRAYDVLGEPMKSLEAYKKARALEK